MEKINPQKVQTEKAQSEEQQHQSQKQPAAITPVSLRQRELQETIANGNPDVRTAQLRSVIDSSPQVKKSAAQQHMVNQSHVVQQASLVQQGISNSTMMAVQRQRQEDLFSIPRRRRQEKESTVQMKKDTHGSTKQESTVQQQGNGSGLPDTLKSGVEDLSGMSMEGVKVHYNSGKPAQLNALAYAQGEDIHLGPGQEKHLPHEAWHVVQQKQGRVQHTMQMKNISVNNDAALEAEADSKGQEALQRSQSSGHSTVSSGGSQRQSSSSIVQRVIGGLEGYAFPALIPEEWVDAYIQDVLTPTAHIYEADIYNYLNKVKPGWMNIAQLENVNGDHWDVTFTHKDVKISTRADGNCGLYAIHAIINEASIGMSQDNYVADGMFVLYVRTQIQKEIAQDRDEIRKRIAGQIRTHQIVEECGFGPHLEKILSPLQTIPVQDNDFGNEDAEMYDEDQKKLTGLVIIDLETEDGLFLYVECSDTGDSFGIEQEDSAVLTPGDVIEFEPDHKRFLAQNIKVIKPFVPVQADIKWEEEKEGNLILYVEGWHVRKGGHNYKVLNGKQDDFSDGDKVHYKKPFTSYKGAKGLNELKQCCWVTKIKDKEIDNSIPGEVKESIIQKQSQAAQSEQNRKSNSNKPERYKPKYIPKVNYAVSWNSKSLTVSGTTGQRNMHSTMDIHYQDSASAKHAIPGEKAHQSLSSSIGTLHGNAVQGHFKLAYSGGKGIELTSGTQFNYGSGKTEGSAENKHQNADEIATMLVDSGQLNSADEYVDEKYSHSEQSMVVDLSKDIKVFEPELMKLFKLASGRQVTVVALVIDMYSAPNTVCGNCHDSLEHFFSTTDWKEKVTGHLASKNLKNIMIANPEIILRVSSNSAFSGTTGIVEKAKKANTSFTAVHGAADIFFVERVPYGKYF